jgi:phosphomevalonate kinase
MRVKRTAPGKVFLSGEYLALEGGSAIILSTKQRSRVSIEDHKKPYNLFYSSALDQYFEFSVNDNFEVDWVENDPQSFGLFISLAICELKIKPSKALISIDTNEFYSSGKKIGLGSSASIASAIINALDEYFNLQLSESAKIQKAVNIHGLSQDNFGSGLDVIASCADSGVVECNLKMANEHKWRSLKWPSDLYIKGVITSDQSSTKMMIEKYNRGKDSNQIFFNKLYSEINHLLNQISTAWDTQNSAKIIELMQTYNTFINQLNEKFNLGIFSDEHKQLIELARSADIFYKPSGAGGGDLGLVITNSEKKLTHFLSVLSDSNFPVIDLR